jgi:O-antigen ligase
MNRSEHRQSASPRVRGRWRSSELATGFLSWTLCAYLFLTYIRPQDMVSALGKVRPGWPITILVLAACLPFVGVQLQTSKITRLSFAFLAVVCFGLVATVNQYWWFQTTWMHLVTTIVFLVGMPVLLRNPVHRDSIIRIMMLGFWVLAVWVITHHGRGYGAMLEDENDVAAWLGAGVCFAVYLGVMGKGKIRQILGWCLVALSVAAIVVSNSRGGFLGLLAAGLAIIWFARRLFLGAAITAVLIVVAYPLLPSGYVEKRLMSATDPNDGTRRERIYSWHRGWDMFVDHPVVGVGAGNFAWQVGKYDSTEAAIQERRNGRSVAGRAAHSMYFQLLPETGIAGSVCYLLLLCSAFAVALRVRGRKSPSDVDRVDQGLALAAASSLVALSVSGAFLSMLFYPHVWFLFGVMAFVSLKYPDVLSAEAKGRPSNNGRYTDGGGEVARLRFARNDGLFARRKGRATILAADVEQNHGDGNVR